MNPKFKSFTTLFILTTVLVVSLATQVRSTGIATDDSPSSAWTNNELYVLIAIEFDQVNTSYNAWNLLSGILFFGLPGINWMLDILIHIPIWIAEIYLTFILVLRTIGAIFGGGA